MPNVNYRKGAVFERKIVNRFKRYKTCTFVARTAGSHSPFDVIAIIGNDLLLIQCKAKGMTEGERRKIKDALPIIPAELNVKMQLRYRKDHREVVSDV